MIKRSGIRFCLALLLALLIGVGTATPVLAATKYEYYNTGDNLSRWVEDDNWLAQTFTTTGAYTITSVKLKLYRTGSPGTLTVGIRTTDGEDEPVAPDLCSGTTDGNTLTTDNAGEWREITLSDYNLNAATQYAIVIRVSGAEANRVYWRYDSTGDYAGGHGWRSNNSGGIWYTEPSWDFMFENWGYIPTAPTVTTQAVSDIADTTATGNGNITDAGLPAPDKRGIVYGTTSKGDPGTAAPPGGYDDYEEESPGPFGTGAFTRSLTGLTPGQIYYARAYAYNSAGYNYGGEVNFYTLPGNPSNLSATTISDTQIDLTWTKGTGGDKTMVRRAEGDYPANPAAGDQAYFDTGVAHSDVGRTPSTLYYYRIWAYDTDSGDYSSGYSSDTATTYGPPDMTTNAASLVGETTATLNGEITAINGANAITRGFEWDIDSGAPYANDWHEDGDFGVANFTHALTLLTKGELYYYRAYATNTYGTGYGDEVTFLTKPDPPNTFVATAVSGTQVDFTWVKGTGASKTYIRGKDGSYPANRTDGYEVYFDTGTSDSDTGLTGGHTYYYKAWGYAEGSEQYSDLFAFAYASPGLSVELHFQPVTIVVNTGASGTADSGDTTFLVDDALTQADDYWNLARLVITDTTDDLAPKGETAVITDFVAADDKLIFAALTAAVGAGDTYTVDFGTLIDRATSVSNDGVITWGVNPGGVTVTVGALLPETQSAASATAEEGVPEFVPETDTGVMATTGTEGEGFPGYLMVKGLLADWAELGGPDISMPYFWKLVAVVLGWVVGTGVMLVTRNVVFGIIAYFVGFAVPAGAMGGTLDLWVPIVYALGAVAISLLVAKWGTSSL